jgi:fumarate hydratase subunit beta
MTENDTVKTLQLPLSEADVIGLKAGDRVRLSGILYTARDAAHRRMVDLLDKGQPLPIDLRDQCIYYVGPTPAKPGQVIGSAGPTTSYRMDQFTIPLLEAGLRGMIGKGRRSAEVKAAMQQHKAVYFAAIGGAAALIAQAIKGAEVVVYEDLGPEAIHRLTVEAFPVIVAIDTYGNNLYETGPQVWRESQEPSIPFI